MNHPTILVVEVHDVLRRAISSWLHSVAPNVSLLAADSLQAALDIMTVNNIDAVLVDTESAGMNGVAAIRELRTHVPTTTVVVYSIQDDSEIVASACAAGAFGFVSKSRITKDLLPLLREIPALQGRLGNEPPEDGI